MRKEQPDPAKLVFERQRLALELHPIIANDLGAHIGFGGFLYVRMSELEHYFGLAGREAVCIGDAPAQNERVVVQPGVLGIYKQDFPDFDGAPSKSFVENFTPHLSAGAGGLCEIKEVLDAT